MVLRFLETLLTPALTSSSNMMKSIMKGNVVKGGVVAPIAKIENFPLIGQGGQDPSFIIRVVRNKI